MDRSAPTDATERASSEPTVWFRSTAFLALLGALLNYLAQPPVDAWPLGWVAFAPWCLLIRTEKLAGRRPYRTLWFAGFLYWFATLHWIRLPHPLTIIGLFPLAAYLAAYIPLFVGLSRVAVRRVGMPLVVAAPVVWYGLELAKGHLFSGFTMGSLCYTQVHWPLAIQICDIFGSYGLSALLVMCAAALAQLVRWPHSPAKFRPLLVALAVSAISLSYGYWKLSNPLSSAPSRPGPRVAIIQSSVEVSLKFDPVANRKINPQLIALTDRMLAKVAPVDLIVWPETMYRETQYSFSDDWLPPADAQLADGSPLTREIALQDAAYRREKLANVARHKFHTNLLFGVDRAHFTAAGPELFNSAMFVHADGTIKDAETCDKMHLVMFGEYIPFADWLPWLYTISPLAGGVRAGEHFVALNVAGCRIAPDICYETVVPHQIRRQVNELRARNEEPDILLNVTNDGWFHGSSQLDQHLACAVFRAVECRKPVLIAANTGFSAEIDAYGRIRWQGKRWDEDFHVAQPIVQPTDSVYLLIGDLPAKVCVVICMGLAFLGWRKRGE